MKDKHDKHYTIDYLDDTAGFLQGLKQDSYDIFEHVRENDTLVDLGCGNGYDAINLAKRFSDKYVNVIGVDHDPEMIKAARKKEVERDNVEFVLSEVSSLPLKSKSVGGVRAERLVQHLRDPGVFFNEIDRILKPGGYLSIIETDWRSLVFYNGDPKLGEQVNSYLTYSKVNNGLAARRLIGDFLASDFAQLNVQIRPFVLATYEDACKYLWIDRVLQEMVDKGSLSTHECEAFIQAQNVAGNAGCFACCINMVLITGAKHEAA